MSLASQIRTEYIKSSILYDRILRSRVILLNNSDTSFSVNINSSSKSYSYLQKKEVTKFNRDIEEFYNPKITKVEVFVKGSANEIVCSKYGILPPL